MSKKAAIFLFLLIISPIIIYFLWPTDESRIKRLVREGTQAVEKEDMDGVMSKISFSYSDDYGLTYAVIRRVLTEQFKTMSGIDVEYENLTVNVKGEDAATEMDIRVIATQGEFTGYFVGDAKEPARLKLSLKKERMKWLVVKTEGLAVRGLTP